MRCRFEMLNGDLIVRHVPTDQIIGRVRWCADPPEAPMVGHFLDYEAANGEKVPCGGAIPENPLKCALSVAADHPEYPEPPKEPPHPYRVKWLLGEVLADAVAVM